MILFFLIHSFFWLETSGRPNETLCWTVFGPTALRYTMQELLVTDMSQIQQNQKNKRKYRQMADKYSARNLNWVISDERDYVCMSLHSTPLKTGLSAELNLRQALTWSVLWIFTVPRGLISSFWWPLDLFTSVIIRGKLPLPQKKVFEFTLMQFESTIHVQILKKTWHSFNFGSRVL